MSSKDHFKEQQILIKSLFKESGMKMAVKQEDVKEIRQLLAMLLRGGIIG